MRISYFDIREKKIKWIMFKIECVFLSGSARLDFDVLPSKVIGQVLDSLLC